MPTSHQDRKAAAEFLGFIDWDDVMDYRTSNFDQNKANRLADLFAQRRVDHWGEAPREGQIEALSFANFQCGPLAHVYQKVGEFVDADGRKLPAASEFEQAFILHKFVRLYLIHGDDWKKLGGADELERVNELAKAAGK